MSYLVLNSCLQALWDTCQSSVRVNRIWLGGKNSFLIHVTFFSIYINFARYVWTVSLSKSDNCTEFNASEIYMQVWRFVKLRAASKDNMQQNLRDLQLKRFSIPPHSCKLQVCYLTIRSHPSSLQSLHSDAGMNPTAHENLMDSVDDLIMTAPKASELSILPSGLSWI